MENFFNLYIDVCVLINTIQYEPIDNLLNIDNLYMENAVTFAKLNFDTRILSDTKQF